MTTNFKALLKEAIKVSQKTEELGKLHKLTAKAFLRDAMENANTTHLQLNALEQALKKPLLERSKQFYRNALKFLKEPSCSCPPKEPKRLTWLVLGKEDELYAELSTVNSNIFELFALAVREAAKTFPERFGTIENMDKHREELISNEQKREELFQRIEKEFSRDDLSVGSTNKQGWTQVTFAISGGEVPFGDHAGERLINWLRNHPEAMKAL